MAASADGSLVVYAGDRDLWRHDFAGGEDRVTTGYGVTAPYPRVSPDVRFVAYSESRSSSGFQLRVIGVNG